MYIHMKLHISIFFQIDVHASLYAHTYIHIYVRIYGSYIQAYKVPSLSSEPQDRLRDWHSVVMCASGPVGVRSGVAFRS